MSRRFALLLALACAGSLSCGSRDSGIFAPKAPVLNLRMEVTTVSQGPGQPVDIRAVVRNAGGVSVDHINMCPIPVVRLYDGQNVEVLQRDPTQPVACPLMLPAPLGPGQSVEFTHMFDGTTFSASGERLVVPPGTYRAVATFEYRTVPTDEYGAKIVEASFVWD